MATPIICHCKHPNDPWRCFCGGCGAKLEPACAKCGFVNTKADRFCGGCGCAIARVAAPQIPPPKRMPPPAPRKQNTVPIESMHGAIVAETPT